MFGKPTNTNTGKDDKSSSKRFRRTKYLIGAGIGVAALISIHEFTTRYKDNRFGIPVRRTKEGDYKDSRTFYDKKLGHEFCQFSTMGFSDGVYDGEEHLGKPHGYGTWMNKSGTEVYKGMWKDGRKFGRGTFTSKVGVFAGIWDGEAVDGECVVRGIRFKGVYTMRHGFAIAPLRGEKYMKNGDVRIGVFDYYFTPAGETTVKFKNGDVFVGSIRIKGGCLDDLFNGQHNIDNGRMRFKRWVGVRRSIL